MAEEREDLVWICGIGSMMDPASSKRTFSAERVFDFQPGRLRGYKRVFNLVSVSSYRDMLNDPVKGRVAVVAACPDPESTSLVSVLRIPRSTLPLFRERQHRYRIVEEDVELCGAGEFRGQTVRALVCSQNTDEEYMEVKCRGDPDRYQERVGQYYTGKLWRDDVFPITSYLGICLRAAAGLGPEWLENFLDCSFLADGVTTIRQYLAENPELEDEVVSVVLPDLQRPLSPLSDASSETGSSSRGAVGSSGGAHAKRSISLHAEFTEVDSLSDEEEPTLPKISSLSPAEPTIST